MTYAQMQLMTQQERFALAAETYENLAREDPDLEENPGLMAEKIVEATGLDFTTAATVALSAAQASGSTIAAA